jgi:hypothetical protein
MLRKVFTGSFILAAMAIVPMFARAEFQAGNWELELGGSGTANHQVSAATFSIEGDFGYFITKNLEVALRQTVGYADAEHAGPVVSATTAVAADWNFDFGNFVPFAGGNVGYSYGTKNTTGRDVWAAGPEGGLKFFVNSTTFIYGLVGYEFLFAENKGGSSGFTYSLGIGVALK